MPFNSTLSSSLPGTFSSSSFIPTNIKSSQRQRSQPPKHWSTSKRRIATALTVNALTILLLLAIKHRILVSRPHLRLSRHVRLPTFERAWNHRSLFCQCRIDGSDDSIDGAKAFALACLLRGGHAPGDFPVEKEKRLAGC